MNFMSSLSPQGEKSPGIFSILSLLNCPTQSFINIKHAFFLLCLREKEKEKWRALLCLVAPPPNTE